MIFANWERGKVEHSFGYFDGVVSIALLPFIVVKYFSEILSLSNLALYFIRIS